MKQSPLQATLQEEATRWFHSLDPVRPVDMIGLWKGQGHPSGHPMDGVLDNLHWYGKRFNSDMRADALLFEGDPGRLVAIDPKFFPVRLASTFAKFGRSARAWNLFTNIRARVRAQGTTASLQARADEGVMTAVMVYDRQPIVDVFRRIDETQVAGMMVVENDLRRFFFRLTKVEDGAVT